MVEKEETQAKNWAEEVDEDDDDAADQAIGNAEEKTEEVKKEEPAKVYDLPERRRNKYGDFVVTNVKVKEKVIPTEDAIERNSDEEEESSDEEEEQLVEIVKEEAKGKFFNIFNFFRAR